MDGFDFWALFNATSTVGRETDSEINNKLSEIETSVDDNKNSINEIKNNVKNNVAQIQENLNNINGIKGAIFAEFRESFISANYETIDENGVILNMPYSDYKNRNMTISLFKMVKGETYIITAEKCDRFRYGTTKEEVSPGVKLENYKEVHDHSVIYYNFYDDGYIVFSCNKTEFPNASFWVYRIPLDGTRISDKTQILTESVEEVKADISDLKNKIENIPDDSEKESVLADIIMDRPPCVNNLKEFFDLQRTGKVYQTKLWKTAINPTSEGIKLLDNVGLKFTPSTDTVIGEDDYTSIPLFKWWHCNYIREDNEDVKITAIEGDENFATTGSVDVGSFGMSFYWNWDDSNEDYTLVTISDKPNDKYGLVPWVECVNSDGTISPYWCHSAYNSVVAEDGLLRSQPGKIARAQSYSNMVTNYQKKGKGYRGAGSTRNTFQIIFNVIMGATKNSQNLYSGVTNYNFQYETALPRDTEDTYFVVTAAQATNIEVGGCVSIGYGSATSKDRALTSIHQYAEDVNVLKKVALEDGNVAVYVDVKKGFPTNDTVDGIKVVMSSMPIWAGETDTVIGRHNGSIVSNNSGKHAYRVQGTEYANGVYVVASDTVMIFKDDYSKDVYVRPKGVAVSTSESTIKSTYKLVGNIPSTTNGADFWVGDISVDVNTGVWHPIIAGGSSATGYGDRCYAGGKATTGLREFLQGGNPRSGSDAGSVCLSCYGGLSSAGWDVAGAD